jgi:murein DD-endopeptidase MepM/ murein hydrolase activator NlpD
MNSLLENQKIRKRMYFGPAAPAGNSPKGLPQRASVLKNATPRDSSRKHPAKPSNKAAFRPAGIISLFEKNSRLIDNIRQEPARVHRKKQTDITRYQNHNIPEEAQDTNVNERRRLSYRRGTVTLAGLGGGFSLPLIPVSALFLLVLGVFFVVQSQGGLTWIDRHVVNFEDHQTRQYNLALYAGLNPLANQEINSAPNPESGDIIPGDDIPLDLTEVFAWHSYRVRRGDSVSRIAADFSVSMDAIIASNGITNARALREGETLRIPNMDGIPYVVKYGDSLSQISASMGVPLEAILDANDIQSDVIYPGKTLFIPGARMDRQELRMALGELFIHPVRGARLTSPFGWRNDPITGVRRHHAAVDLAAPVGTPVRAAMEGRVSALGFNTTYGNFVIISHPGNYQSLYAHLHAVSVRRGDQVRQGGQIGTVGNTGYSTGPHLHFAIYRNGRAVNPLDFMSSQR